MAGKKSRNWEMKLEVFEFVIAENLAWFPFLQVRVIPFLGNEMMDFLQSIIASSAKHYHASGAPMLRQDARCG